MAVAVDGRGCWTSGQPKLNNPSCRGCGCRKRESERLKPPLCGLSLRCSTSERAREQPADAPHNSSAAQYPRTTSLRTTQHTRHRHERAGLRIAHWRPFLLGRGLSTHPIACCNPVTDPNPQPSSASHLIHPSHLLLCFRLPRRDHV